MRIEDVYAVVLCGGQGTRLRSVIGDAQKVMADVDGLPFLDYLIKYLNDQGIKKIVLCAGYKLQDIKKRYAQKVEHISEEKQPLGTAGAIKHAASSIKSDIFFALNGDCFCAIDYKDLLDAHLKNKAEATIVAAKVKDKKDYGTINIGHDNRIEGFYEKQDKSSSVYVNAGMYCLNKELLNTKFSSPASIEKQVFPELIRTGKFYAYKTDREFLDIGTPERYDLAQDKLRKMY